MPARKSIIILILIIIFSIGLTACRNNTSTISDMGNSSQQVTDAQATGSEIPGQEVAEEATVQQILPSVDKAASAESLLANWTDINTEGGFAKITKSDTGFQYEDNEGKYPASFQDGILKVKVSENDTADAYLDSSSGHLILVYQDSQFEFTMEK